MLRCCQESFVTTPGWKPSKDIAGYRRYGPRYGRDHEHDGRLTLADIVEYALES